jgi:IS30 family transposase
MEGMRLPKSYISVIPGKRQSGIYRELTRNRTNGLIRQYLPKKIPFDTLTQKLPDKNRPRKVLGCLTPYEAFSP